MEGKMYVQAFHPIGCRCGRCNNTTGMAFDEIPTAPPNIPDGEYRIINNELFRIDIGVSATVYSDMIKEIERLKAELMVKRTEESVEYQRERATKYNALNAELETELVTKDKKIDQLKVELANTEKERIGIEKAGLRVISTLGEEINNISKQYLMLHKGIQQLITMRRENLRQQFHECDDGCDHGESQDILIKKMKSLLEV